MQENIVVTAIVSPLRIIVVDKNLSIKEIVSNTKEEVVPKVRLEDENGRELDYSNELQKQYLSIKQFWNFSKPGIFYPQKTDQYKLVELFKLLFSKLA